MARVTDIAIIANAAQNFAKSYEKRRNSNNKLGLLEKQLIGTSIFLALLFLIFCTLFFIEHNYYEKLLKEKICKSNECIESAMMLLQTVDFSQDPCTDFYNYACGKFSVEHPLNENDLHNSWFAEKDMQLNRMILDILKSEIRPSDLNSVKQTKQFFQSCMNKTELNEVGLEPLYDILELLELPRSIPNNETIGNFNLGRTLALAQRLLSQDILVSVALVKESESTNGSSSSSGDSTIFKLSPTMNSLTVFDVWKRDKDIFNMKHSRPIKKGKTSPRKEKERHHSNMMQQPLSKHMTKATIKFISMILQKVNENSEDEINLPKSYNSSYYVQIARKIMNFTSVLLQSVEKSEEKIGLNKTEKVTFEHLEMEMNGQLSNTSFSNRIDWKEYINVLLENSNKTYDLKTMDVIVENVIYFKMLAKILEGATSELIQMHVWWKIVEQYAKYTSSDVRAIYIKYYQAIYGETTLLPRSQVCSNMMKSTMSVAISYEMAALNNFSTTSQKVFEMLRDIETAFEAMVNDAPWMDEQTKFVTVDKAKAVRNEIGFANWITNSTKIDQFYQELELKESEFLMNILRVSEWEVHKILETLGTNGKQNSTVSIPSWFVNPLQVNAYYSHVDNAIFVPAGILRTPFYFRGLESLNYGAIGTILGHELTHGFDIDGKNYNKFGIQDNLWPKEIMAEYETRAKCFVNQYDNYVVYGDQKLNGTFTLAENIADNGGIRESFKAYQLYIARHGQEPKLPGFENFTHEQLLFLSYANIWCEAATSKYYMLSQDSHSPQRIRVLATLQNMKEFSDVYKCSKNSFMNPPNKCIIW